MPRAASVIVRVERPGAWLTRLLASLDAQTLRHDEFEVLLESADPDSPIAERLDELAGRRPNMRVVAPGTAIAAAEGAWVLDLGVDLDAARPTLPADALERLAALAAGTDGDVVLSRVAARSGGLVSGRFTVAPDDRGPVAGAPDPSQIAFRRAGAGPDSLVRVHAAPPSVVVEQLPAPATPVSTVHPTVSTMSWADGVLTVAVEGTVAAAPAAARVIMSVRERGTGREFWLPTATEGDVVDRFAATAEVDVRVAGLGHALTEGVWELRIGVFGDAESWGRQAAVPPAVAPVGLVDGIVVVPGRDKDAATLDVGARRQSPIGALRAGDVSFAESARGTLLTARLPGVAVCGAARLPGQVLLGDFALPAVLVAEAGAARIESYVSGLAGSSALGTRFGAAKAAPTGLTLRISPVGAMDVVATPAAGPAAAATSRATPAKPAARGAVQPTSAVARLRRRVPTGLEPAVRKLAGNGLARRAYRRLGRR